MRIEHVAVYVSDLDKTREFFESFFEGTSGERYHNRNTGFMSYFLSFQNGSRLEIMTRPDRYTEDRNENRLGFVHLAFSVGSKDKVDALTLKLKEAGFETISGPRTTGDGYYESCIQGPDSIQIEITA
ncbi:VOC family protein [Succinivibrio dextrinosolvens]|uniref:VOC family protein n=1 Tax=Succinivibrio dextrinosolvens TaxID=83771 RepID=UPI001920CBE4|nr:VOC family protein [Succinivibrio dextrinosolvens]